MDVVSFFMTHWVEICAIAGGVAAVLAIIKDMFGLTSTIVGWFKGEPPVQPDPGSAPEAKQNDDATKPKTPPDPKQEFSGTFTAGEQTFGDKTETVLGPKTVVQSNQTIINNPPVAPPRLSRPKTNPSSVCHPCRT